MTQLSPALDAALRADAPVVFGAVSLALPGVTVNLLDGAGQLTFGGKTYVGEDATFGVLAAVESLSDGLGDSAPALTISLFPASSAAAASLAAPNMQGSAVTVHLGAVDRATGAVIPDPYLLFLGELDVPVLQSGADTRKLDYTVVSVFERLFESDEASRLSPGYHRSIFPNEAGLDMVTGVDQPVYWGLEGAPSAITYGGTPAYFDPGSGGGTVYENIAQ
jgi:hypothetical protein